MLMVRGSIARLGLITLAAAFIAAAAAAQSAPPARVRGVIEKLDGHMLTVKARDGDVVAIKLADPIAVTGIVKATLADVAVGTFVGIAARPLPDGGLEAIEVLIFPESARGTGEGHYAWDLLPESTMTNATVAETVAAVGGRTLTLRYKDGEKKIAVPPEAPVVTFAPGDPSLLKPGAAVFVPARKEADGTLGAARVLVGRDGVVPPM
jgi:hypothetical protein